MTNRSYLPYKAAREYVDRGMAKWMGFFISEHSTALSCSHDNSTCFAQMTIGEIYIRINQAYSYNFNVNIFIKNNKYPLSGNITDIFPDKIHFRTFAGDIVQIMFHDIVMLSKSEISAK